MHFHMQYDMLIRFGWFITHNHSQSIISCAVFISIMMTCRNYIMAICLKPNTIRLFFRCRDMIIADKSRMSIIENFSNGISCASCFITIMPSSYNYLSIRRIISFTC